MLLIISLTVLSLLFSEVAPKRKTHPKSSRAQEGPGSGPPVAAEDATGQEQQQQGLFDLGAAFRSGIANISGLFGGDQGYQPVREQQQQQQQQVNRHSTLSLTMNIKVCSNTNRHFLLFLWLQVMVRPPPIGEAPAWRSASTATNGSDGGPGGGSDTAGSAVGANRGNMQRSASSRSSSGNGSRSGGGNSSRRGRGSGLAAQSQGARRPGAGGVLPLEESRSFVQMDI